MPEVKVFAFYLPQFHPFKQNDEWWGKGFTEWTNVSQSRPRFAGHYQPHVPADLGFYDLRLEQTRADQAELARQHGVYGFCYYHYWFNGQPIMENVLETILSSGKPDLPFFLCWANENWTRAWDGQDRQVLVKHAYSPADDIKHMEYLGAFFQDGRYEKVDGRPILAFYRPDNLPNPPEFLRRIRAIAETMGFPGIYCVGVKNGLVNVTATEILEWGFDSIIDFQPNRDHFPTDASLSFYMGIAQKIIPRSIYQLIKTKACIVKRVSYEKFVQVQLNRRLGAQIHPVVFPSWDNSARRKTPTVIENHDPITFKKWLEAALRHAMSTESGPCWVFVNAWNEWAEGCHLEPDRLHRNVFLTAVSEALNSCKGANERVLR